MRPLAATIAAAALALGCSRAPGVPDASSETGAGAVELAGYSPASEGLLRARGWRTDLARRTVALEAIRICGSVGREAFAPAVRAEHAPAAESLLDDAEPVVVVRGAEELRAWPLAFLVERELVVDEVEGTPVAVTFCSLCDAARVWSRRLGRETLELAVSGLVLEGGALLYDRRTESLWRQIDGRAVAGAHAGRRLQPLPSLVVSLGALRRAHPDARVMRAPSSPAPPSPFERLSARDVEEGEPPGWLALSCPRPLEPALALGEPGAPDELLPVAGPRVETAGETLVLRDPACATPFRTQDGRPGPRLGAANAFRRTLAGRRLTFEAATEGGARDVETDTRWSGIL